MPDASPTAIYRYLPRLQAVVCNACSICVHPHERDVAWHVPGRYCANHAKKHPEKHILFLERYALCSTSELVRRTPDTRAQPVPKVPGIALEHAFSCEGCGYFIVDCEVGSRLNNRVFRNSEQERFQHVSQCAALPPSSRDLTNDPHCLKPWRKCGVQTFLRHNKLKRYFRVMTTRGGLDSTSWGDYLGQAVIGKASDPRLRLLSETDNRSRSGSPDGGLDYSQRSLQGFITGAKMHDKDMSHAAKTGTAKRMSALESQKDQLRREEARKLRHEEARRAENSYQAERDWHFRDKSEQVLRKRCHAAYEEDEKGPLPNKPQSWPKPIDRGNGQRDSDLDHSEGVASDMPEPHFINSTSLSEGEIEPLARQKAAAKSSVQASLSKSSKSAGKYTVGDQPRKSKPKKIITSSSDEDEAGPGWVRPALQRTQLDQSKIRQQPVQQPPWQIRETAAETVPSSDGVEIPLPILPNEPAPRHKKTLSSQQSSAVAARRRHSSNIRVAGTFDLYQLAPQFLGVLDANLPAELEEYLDLADAAGTPTERRFAFECFDNLVFSLPDFPAGPKHATGVKLYLMQKRSRAEQLLSAADQEDAESLVAAWYELLNRYKRRRIE